MDIHEICNELKAELESNQDGFFMITPSKDKEELDDAFQKFNAQNDDQKRKSDIRSFALYGMNNYDHYHILLSKIKKGTKDDQLDGLEYNRHDEEVVKEDYNVFNIYKEFGCKSSSELKEKINSAIEFNTNSNGRVIIYPTKDANELESLYMKYMALETNERASSDNKSTEIFGLPNREIYKILKDLIKTKNDDIDGTHKVEDENIDKVNDKESSLFSNDLPLLTPKELENKVEENYECFNKEDGEKIKIWRESYSLLEHGIKVPEYNKYNLDRINILRKSIYENNNDAIIQCGWIPGIEFNSENRSKASKLVRDKMDALTYNSISIYNESYIEEAIIFNKNDLYWKFDDFESGKSNILLITGLSGSGKSTLGKQLSKKYKAEYIELDCISDIIKNNRPYILQKWMNTLSSEELKDLYKDPFEGEFQPSFLNFCINYAKNNKDKKFIIEGIQIYELFKDKARNYPLIIKGTSVLKSFYQRSVKREKWDYKTFLKYSKDDLSWLIRSDKDLDELKKSINESNTTNTNKKAVSIVLVQGNSLLGKTIRKVQGTEFSHASISLDEDLKRIYSFNMRGGNNGLTYESVKAYIEDGVSKMGVYTFLVSDKVYKQLEKILDNFNLYKNKTKYSVLNLLTIPFNIDLDLDMKMVCSEFVDKLLKLAEIDLTNKKSSLVSPKDFINATKSKPNIIEVFNDHPRKFKPLELKKKIEKLKKSNLPVYEFVEYNDEFINEAKSFPIQFDNNGNLLLKNIKRIDFEQEYTNSHRLLMEYDKQKSYDPMKFELAKMQFFITLLEKKIYKQGKDKSVKELKVRARFLNDFKKYLKIVVANDKTFNFTEYYEQSPFNDAIIQIDNNTLKYGWKALKYMIS